MNFESLIPSFFQLKNFGIIEASGPDVRGFLHRMSTNNIEALEPGSNCLTAFVNQKARLIAICYVRRANHESYQLIVPYESAETLLQWLEQYLFVEDVSLVDKSSDFNLIWTIGKPEKGIKGPDFLMSGTSIPSSLVLCEARDTSAFRDRLKAQNFKELDKDEFETLRIAGCVPFSKNEINDSHHPIQLGLNNAIHWAKGCYIGQEVISRLESKDKASKTLIGLNIASEDLHTLQVGETIEFEGPAAGVLTSVAPLYLDDQSNALAVLKRPIAKEQGRTVLSQVRIDIAK